MIYHLKKGSRLDNFRQIKQLSSDHAEKRPLRVFGTHVLTVDIIGLVGGRNTKTTALIAGAPFPFPLFRAFLSPPTPPFLRLPRRLIFLNVDY